MNIKKIITGVTAGVTTALLVSCQPAMASEKYVLQHSIPMCLHESLLLKVEQNYKRGLSMDNEELFMSGLCKLIFEPTQVELNEWPIEGSISTLVNLRMNGVVYTTRKFYLKGKLTKEVGY